MCVAALTVLILFHIQRRVFTQCVMKLQSVNLRIKRIYYDMLSISTERVQLRN